MSETTGPSTTVPASTESSSSQAAYTPSPVRQQQPQVSHPVEHGAHRSGPSLTSERVQDVAGFDKSGQAAPVQGQNMATGGFRSSSGVPSEDELAQLYSNEDGAQGSAGQVSKVDTDGGDLPEDLNIGFSGKGPGIYGSFATGKSATRGPTASQAEQAGQGQGPVPSMMQLPESEEFRTHHQPEGVGSTEAAPFVASGVAPMSQGEKPLLEKAQLETTAQAVAASEGHPSANPPAELEGPQQTVALDQQRPSHAEIGPKSGTPPPQQLTSETVFVSKQSAEPQLSPAELGVPPTALPQHDIPPIFEPEHYTPQYSSRPKFDAPSSDADTLPQPEITPFEPRSAPLTEVTSQQLTQDVGGSGGHHEAALGVQTGSQEEVPFGRGQPASLEGQQERETVPTEGHGSNQGYGSNAAGSNTGSSIAGGIASYIPGTEANREARAEHGKTPDAFSSGNTGSTGGGVASYIPGTEANRVSRAEQDSGTGSNTAAGLASYVPGTQANQDSKAAAGQGSSAGSNTAAGLASYIPGTQANQDSKAAAGQGSSTGSTTAAGLASYIPGTQANQDSKAAAGQDSSTHTSGSDNTGGGLLGGLMSYIPGTEANRESRAATGQESITHNSGSGSAEGGAVSYSDQQVSSARGGESDSQQAFKPFSIVGADADTWSYYKKPAGQGIQALAEGSEQYPATPERLNRQPHPASPEDVQGLGSAAQGAAPSGAAVTREAEYNAPAPTGPVHEQEAPLSGSRGFTDIPNYPRENPLFDEEQQQQQQQQEEAEPEAAPKFYENPEFDSSGRSAQQTLGSPMIPNRSSPQQQQTYDSPAYTEQQNQPHTDNQGPTHSTAGHTSSVEIPPEFDQEQHRYGQPYESSDMHRALSGPRPVASEAVTAANDAAGQEVLANSAVEPEADTLSNTAEDGHIGGEPAAFEQSGAIAGRVTSRPQLGGAVEQVVPQQAVEQETVVEPFVEVDVVETAPSVPVEQEVIVREPELPATYSGPQIVSKEADLTPLPPSAAWGPATIYAPYTAPPRAAPYVPPTQESVTVAQPVVETETVMVEQDPPIDPSVERAEPTLPVSTRTTGMLTSTPQLGPATTTATTATVATTEISPVTQETTVTQAAPLPTPMTREEITSYRPAQDPPIDPSQGQAPVQVSTNLAVEPRPAPRAPVMSTAEIAAYRSGEDPAYDPVERRGWWEVDMAQGGGTILPATTRGPSRGRRGTTGTRGAGRATPPALTGPHIHPGGDPSQATHFGSILPGVRSGAGRGRGMEQAGGAPGLYDAPPLGGRYASGAPLTPAPTPVAPLGDGETRDVPTAVKGLGQDPVYDPTEGASGSALPSAGNDQIDNPLFEEQQQQDISGTAYDQGTAFSNTSNVPFASPRQQEFYSTMYGSAASGIQRDPSSALSDTSLSSLDASEQPSAQHESPSRNPHQSSFASMGNHAFSDQPLLGTQQSPIANRQQPPSVAAASLGAFYQGPFFPRKTSLPLPTQQVESAFSEAPTEGLSGTAEPFVTPVSVSHAPAFSSRPLLGAPQQQDDTTLVSSAEAYAEEPASSAQQVQFAKPLTIPTHPDLHDDEQQYYAESAAPSPAAAEPYSQAVQTQLPIIEQRTLFADGPMFDGSPLSSPVDVPAPHQAITVQQQASVAIPEPAALHSGPIFRDNPVFSDALEQEGPTPFIVRQGPSVASPASPVVATSPSFSSRPILGGFEQQAEPALPSVPAHQQPLLPHSQLPSADHSPAFASTPILGPHAQQQQQIVPLVATPQASVEFSEPTTHAPAFSSQPSFSEPQQLVHQPIPDATPVQDELPPSLTQETIDHEPAFSDQPIFGVSAQQQEQVYTPAEVVMPLRQQPALTTAPEFSSKPLLGAYQQQEQQSLVHSPAQIATPMQEEPAVILSKPVVTGQSGLFSSTPIFGTQPQPQQQQQDIYTPLPSVAEPLQDPLYDPTQGRPAAVQFETPAAIASPTFQSRPIFGQQQQTQQVQVQSASADNPWANRETLLAEREPSFALASSASPRQGINFYDNTLFESADQPQILSDGITFQSSPPLSSQQPAYSPLAQQPARQRNSAASVEQDITFHSVSPFDAPQRSSPVTPVPALVPAPFLSSQPTLGMPAPTDTAQLRTAQQDTAQRVHYSPASTFASPAPTRATPLTGGGPAFSDTPLLGGPGGVVTTRVTYTPAAAAQPTTVEEPLSDPLYDPTAQRAVRVPIAPARPAALLEPLDDPLYDPLQRRPVVAQSAVHQVKPMVLQPLEDPLYDPTVQRRSMIGQAPSAAPHGPRGSRFVSAQNSRFLQHVDDPLYDPAAVESAPGLQKDVTHRGEQVGTPHFARQQQQQPSAFGAAPTSGDIVTRPVMGSTRRPPRTVNLADIGRPAPLPPVQEQQYEAPEPKPEFELGGADVLPRDEHYVKPTPYDELGANARSALSGAGWKTKWAVEMEATAQRGGQALKYPVGPVVPKGASGFAPKASTAIVGEPDYAALARGEPGFTVPGADLQDTPPLGGPSAASGGVAPQPSYMQTAAPPVQPGAPVVDRGFTGPGGAAGGARRRLGSKLFDRQHSLQDPSFDPVSQRFGRDEGYGVELPVHRPPHVPTGRASAGLGSDQGVVGGPSRGSRASSQAGFGVRQPQYEEEEIIPEEQEIQEEAVPVVDKTKEMNERLLVEVRKRLQAAKSQLNSAPPSEADAGTPVDSPLGGRPTVLQNRTSEGTPGYWRTLEEVEAEGSNPMSRNAPSPWVQTHGPELVPRRLFQAGGASTGIGGAPRMRTGIISSGKVANKGLEGYGSGRVHNIAGGYPNRVSRGGNQYSWGREGVF